jgi:hypothetical protein
MSSIYSQGTDVYAIFEEPSTVDTAMARDISMYPQ